MDKKKRRMIWGCGAGILLIAAAVFFFCFQITSVKVEGNKNYTENEIRNMILTGPLSGNSVLVMLLNPDERTKDAEFIKKVWLERTDTHSITIHVREKELIGYVKFLNDYFYFDRDGIVQVSSIEQLPDIPFIEGIELKTVRMGEKLEGLSKEGLNLVLSVTKMLEKDDWKPDRMVLDEKDRLFMYYGNVEVRMGTYENIEEKISRLLGIIPQIEDMEGILHLENVNASAKNVTFERKLSEAEQKALEKTGDTDSEDGDETLQEEYDTGESDNYNEEDEYSEYDSYDAYDTYEDYDAYDGYEDEAYETEEYGTDSYEEDTYEDGSDGYSQEYYEGDYGE